MSSSAARCEEWSICLRQDGCLIDRDQILIPAIESSCTYMLFLLYFTGRRCVISDLLQVIPGRGARRENAVFPKCVTMVTKWLRHSSCGSIITFLQDGFLKKIMFFPYLIEQIRDWQETRERVSGEDVKHRAGPGRCTGPHYQVSHQVSHQVSQQVSQQMDLTFL